MEHLVINKHKIETTPEKAFQAILDCKMWPEFVPGVELVEVLDEKGNKMTRRLHTRINGKINKMKTECEIFPEQHKMLYKQVERPWPISSNMGEWYIEKVDEKTIEMFLTHRLKVKYSIIGDLIGMFIIKPLFIYSHNKKVLKAFAKRLQVSN